MRIAMILFYTCAGIACLLAVGSVFAGIAEGSGDPGMGPLVVGLTVLFVTIPLLLVAVISAGVGGLFHFKLAARRRQAALELA